MSSSPDRLMPSYVIRGDEDHGARLARMGEDLTASPFVKVGVTDPRLVDPLLEKVVDGAEMQARARGFRAGFEAGRAAGHAEGLTRMAEAELQMVEAEAVARRERTAHVKAMTNGIGMLVQNALEYQLPLLDQMRDLISEMAVELAEQLVGHHLEVDDCAALDAIQRAMKHAPRGVSVSIHLHPSDMSLVNDLDNDIDWGLVNAIEDESVEPGGAVVVVNNLEIDAQISLAMERVRKVLNP